MFTDMESYITEIEEYIKKPINGKNIILLKYTENISDITLYIKLETYPIKIITDFNRYCLVESSSNELNLDVFNLNIIFKKKQPLIILQELSKIQIKKNIVLFKEVIKNDPFHIFQKIDHYSKINIDFVKLEKDFIKLKVNKITNIINIPYKLLLSPAQISQLLINEIKKINSNNNYQHYIIPDEKNPYNLIVRFKFTKNVEMKTLFNKIQEKFGYDYMEIVLKIEPTTYPFFPPKIEYNKPKIKLSLLLGLINLDILKLENWNPTITLDYLISNLGDQIENIAKDYIVLEDMNTNDTSLEYELLKLTSIIKENNLDKVNIIINVPKIISNDINNKYWKSGTGYGSDSLKSWDIKAYIKEQELQREEITNCLSNIGKLITDDNIEIINQSILLNYIISQVNGLNILELQTNKSLYDQIFNILFILYEKNICITFITSIGAKLEYLADEIRVLVLNNQLNNSDFDNLKLIDIIINNYVTKYQEYQAIKPIIISPDLNNKYCEIMKKIQFGIYELPKFHRFIKFKDQKPEQKSMMRMISEISSLKSCLPLNWESTIFIRVPKNNFNIFSFLISGPKDTPYENGLFEFHVYLPPNYPNSPPQILLHTTGNNKVRFNPNLYDTGKVCLSLLGTWEGQEAEKWNPKTSTFLQVIVSIQSLILIEQPYFNEPGWETQINTSKGKQASADYNDNLYPHTIQLAMIDMINNPPIGFEEIVKEHFSMKKEEIINTTLRWEQNAKNNKLALSTNRKTLIELLNSKIFSS